MHLTHRDLPVMPFLHGNTGDFLPHKIRKLTDTNHAILGIRRIGKTSLLREVQRILKEEQDPAHIVYLECSDLLSTDDYVR